MEVIENAVAQIAGYGVKLFFVLQSLEQLKAVYKENWETFLANSGLKVFFNLEDHFSREYVSKLIGETEVIRETRSASDSVSESESISRSVTHSRSETHGRSSSTGTSETDGTNSSVSTGKSWGANWGESRSHNYSYAQGIIFRHYDNQRIGDSRSQSTGGSITENKGESHGVSHGTSKSRTDGTSESFTTGTSETEGTTHGTSQSRTAGTSETIQKRPLITPDEIGQVFARIDDRKHQAYPGLALAIVAGARPVALRRVNYYEDFQFVGLFEPPSDHPYTPPKELTIEGRTLGLSLAAFGLRLGGWSIAPGQIKAAGAEGALVVTTADGNPAARIRVPRGGMITAVQGISGGDVPEGPLFSLLYYEDGTGLTDPFAEVRALCDQIRAALTAKQREEEEKRRAAERERSLRRKLAIVGVTTCCLVVVTGIIFAIVKRMDAPRGRPDEPPGGALVAKPGKSIWPRRSSGDPGNVENSHIEIVPAHTLMPEYQGKRELINAMAFSPDSRVLATGSIDKTVELWEVATGNKLATLTGQTGWIQSVSFSPDGRGLAAGGSDGTIKLWSVPSGRELASLVGPSDVVWAVAFNPNGHVLASGSDDGTIKFWDVDTGKESSTLPTQAGAVTTVAFSPDGRLLASSAQDHTIRLWNVSTGTELATLSGGQNSTSAVTFSPNGRVLASCSGDTISLWDLSTRTPMTSAGLTCRGSVAFSPDSSAIVSGDPHALRLSDVSSGKELASTATAEEISSIVFSPDGNAIASRGFKRIDIWHLTDSH